MKWNQLKRDLEITTHQDIPRNTQGNIPNAPPISTFFFQCLYGPHKADLLHKGTAYCRACYDEKARQGLLIN